MRVQHVSHPFPAFPVFSCAFVADNELVLGGGGGASRTGIKNRLRLYRVSDDRKLELLSERELDKDEDAPMSMAALQKNRTFACGINASAQKITTGQNENCRVFAIEGAEHTIAPRGTRGTLTSASEDDYQKVTALSPDGTFLAVAGDRDFTLLSYPLLVPAASTIHLANGGIYDASFTDDKVILVTSQNILVYALPSSDSGSSSTSPPPSPSPSSKSKKKGKQKSKSSSSAASSPSSSSSSSLAPNGTSASSSAPELELLQTLGVPALPTTPKGSAVTFRAARFRPGAPDTLHAVLNVTLPRAPRAKVAKRQTYVGVWKLKKGEGEKGGESWELVKNRKVGDGAATCFDTSANGKFLGLGFQDYSVGVFDSQSLLPLCSVLKAHEFAITTLRFSPTSQLLVSASADSTLRVISIPENLGQQTWTMTIIIILTVIVILLAMALAKP